MIRQELLDEWDSLPEEAQRQVEELITLLRRQYPANPSDQTSQTTDQEGEAFIGMWRDREDMADSTAWVRHLRENEWSRGHGESDPR